MTRLALAYIPLALWAAGILAVGGLDVGGAPIPSGWDKVAHFLAYGVGGALAAGAGRWSRRGWGWPGVAFVAVVAVADEIRQSTLPHRSGDPLDLLADLVGALAFFIVARRILRTSAGGT